MPNPYAPRNQRASAASFPEGRLRRLGATDDEIADALRGWGELSAGEQQEAADAIAALTDDELAADLDDGREARELERLSEWARAATDAGTYGDPNEALDALDMLALLSEDDRQALLGVVAPDEIAPGGPGEAAEGSADGTPAADPEPSPVLEDARGRMDQAPSKVLRWVGTDRERAAAVLVLERQADKPRVALVSGAEQVLGA